MSTLWQIILASLGSVSIFGLIFTSVLNRIMAKQYEKQDTREKLRDDNDLLMMARMDCLADLVQLMAKRLHDAKIINGDLSELHNKYKGLEEKYDGNMKSLAHEILKK